MSPVAFLVVVPMLFWGSFFNEEEKPPEDPDEICAMLYGKAMSLHQAARRAAEAGEDRFALSDYYRAIMVLKNIEAVKPDWNSAAVGSKIEYCGRRVKELEEKVEEQERIYREGLAGLQRKIGDNPRDPRPHVDIADFYFNYGKVKDAERELRRAEELGCRDAGTRIKLGNAHEAQGKYDEAISQYREALRLDPGSAHAHYNLGFAYFMMNKNSKMSNRDAIAELKRAIQTDQDFVDAYVCLGMIYNRQKQYSLALEAFKKALLIEPDNPVVNYNMGSTYCSLLNFINAANYMNRAVDLVGRDTDMGKSIREQIAQLRRYNLVGQEGRGYRDRARMLIYKGRMVSGPQFRRWKRRRDQWVEEYKERYI